MALYSLSYPFHWIGATATVRQPKIYHFIWVRFIRVFLPFLCFIILETRSLLRGRLWWLYIYLYIYNGYYHGNGGGNDVFTPISSRICKRNIFGKLRDESATLGFPFLIYNKMISKNYIRSKAFVSYCYSDRLIPVESVANKLHSLYFWLRKDKKSRGHDDTQNCWDPRSLKAIYCTYKLHLQKLKKGPDDVFNSVLVWRY